MGLEHGARDTQGALRVGVVTLGLIGGSLALAAQRQGMDVVSWDRNPQTRDAAHAQGLAVEAELEVLAGSGLDLIVVASPLFAMTEIMATISRTVPEHTTIMDAGSVKEQVRQAVNAAGLNRQFVGAHPMAGTEKSGFANAFAELFHDATWGMTLDSTTEPDRAMLVLRFITDVMQGKVLVTDDRTHDDAVALVSHLPHVLAHTLTAVTAQDDRMPLALKLAAGSFRDGTRVARGSVERNRAMIADNARAVRVAVDNAIAQLETVRDALDAQLNPRDTDATHGTGGLATPGTGGLATPGIGRLTDFFEAGTAVVDFKAETPYMERSVTIDFGNTETNFGNTEINSENTQWRETLLSNGARGRLVTALEHVATCPTQCVLHYA